MNAKQAGIIIANAAAVGLPPLKEGPGNESRKADAGTSTTWEEGGDHREKGSIESLLDGAPGRVPGNSIIWHHLRLSHSVHVEGMNATDECSSSWRAQDVIGAVAEDEILERKHLPPLGLKDFEEWLLLIDRAPENLYFILWLREYTARYSAWARQSRAHPQSRASSPPQGRAYRTLSTPHPPPNPALALFYLRAKETFLTPNGPYALRLPHDVLAPFQSSSLGAGVGGPTGGSWPHAILSDRSDALVNTPGGLPPPPDPAVFAEVADRVRAILTDSLDRFVVATFHNVGMPRAYCGCAGGTVIGLTGSAPILLANFLTGGSRWWRFSALPGLWLGMTIVISAMFGVCMMIYVFGDLRQLRSFELARFPEPELTKEKGKEGLANNKQNIKVVGTDQNIREQDSEIRPHQLVTAPSPALLSNSSPTDQSPTDGIQFRPPRPSPPKLHIIPPQPAHTRTPLHSSSITYPALARLQSLSSASSSCSGHSVKRTSRRPCFATLADMEYETDDGDICDVSGSDYESDYSTSTDSDASSQASHLSITDEGVSMGYAKPSKPIQQKRPRRKRRREPEIHISDAFFDENPCPEGPAMADPQERTGRNSIWGESSEEDVGTGATFIHPFRWEDQSEMFRHDLESQGHCAAECQRMDAFDFDGLPPRPTRYPRTDVTSAPSPSSLAPAFAASSLPAPNQADAEKPSHVHFAADPELGHHHAKSPRTEARQGAGGSRFRQLLGIVQQKCGPKNVARQLLGDRSPGFAQPSEDEKFQEPRTPVSSGPFSPTSTLNPTSPPWSTASYTTAPSSPTSTIVATATPTLTRAPAKATWKTRLRRMLQVPAFASPLTPVLNPVVTRGQWEIVVRSAFIAFLVSAAVIGALVAVPETSVV
ncbi:hypothetical protein PYCCODRAFT_1456139 [Trametes coccinea BRFM310]|uniref:RGS domain-containing protein n=1 Tax=Trametes coccinea (strain BRFM310) TaxID=1353009 RepID=A0A1Y2J463_TRAC3|nr:hypothetical protein PYCCODRAFT_1456139 [Trametes coccinea BRFM310]